MSFARLPVVHLKRGLLQEYPEEAPAEVLAALAQKAEPVYLVDGDGLHRNRADLEAIQAAARRTPLWVDAGSRYHTDVMDLFVAGAERVTVRWNTVHDFLELAEAASLAEDLYLGVEFRDGFLDNPRDPAGTPDLLFRRASDLGLGLVLIDLNAGTHEQVDPRLAQLGARFQGAKWYAGGRGGAYDRETLHDLSYSGMLIPAHVVTAGERGLEPA